MKRRGKQGGSVRDRVPGIKKPESNGTQGEESTVAVQERPQEQTSPPAQPGVKKTPATLADYLAAQLHESQSNLMSEKLKVLNLRQELLKKDQLILNLQKRLHNVENEEVEKVKVALRENHKLKLGAQIKQDDETGEVYWVEQSS